MQENHVEVLLTHLQQTIVLNEQEIQRISEVVELVSLKRKELLLQPGQLSQHMRFIAQGSARCYYLDENSQEHTLQIGIEEWWINDLYSFLTQRESKLFIQAIEPAVNFHRDNNNAHFLEQ